MQEQVASRYVRCAWLQVCQKHEGSFLLIVLRFLLLHILRTFLDELSQQAARPKGIAPEAFLVGVVDDAADQCRLHPEPQQPPCGQLDGWVEGVSGRQLVKNSKFWSICQRCTTGRIKISFWKNI